MQFCPFLIYLVSYLKTVNLEFRIAEIPNFLYMKLEVLHDIFFVRVCLCRRRSRDAAPMKIFGGKHIVLPRIKKQIQLEKFLKHNAVTYTILLLRRALSEKKLLFYTVLRDNFDILTTPMKIFEDKHIV